MRNRTSEERNLQHSLYPDVSDKPTATTEVSRILLAENASTDALTGAGIDHKGPSH
jgi:hypothetical protein